MTVAIQMNDIQVEAVKAYATAHDTTVSDIVRKAVATMIGFDMSTLPAAKIRTKYASKEERDAAYKAAAKTRRDLDTQILAAVQKGDMATAKRLMNDRTKKAEKAAKKAGPVTTK